MKALLLLFFVLSINFSFASRYGVKVSVMTYNAENLFDYYHDYGTEDYQYLPLAYKNNSEEVQEYCSSISNSFYRKRCFEMDWSQEAVFNKVRNIARVIKDAGSPDIIAFQEVENIRVLKMLVDSGLRGEGYQTISLIEGPDPRGIDVGIISKYPLASRVKYHNIDLSSAFEPGESVKLTRGVLETTFNVNGKKLTVMTNHWPSQNNDDETRVIAAKVLINAVSKVSNPVVVTGDFNTVESDEINAIETMMLAPNSKIPFYDVEKVHYNDKKARQRGTHFYRGEWSSLDRFFVRKDQVGHSITPDWRSYRVFKKDYMLKFDQDYLEYVPLRFDPENMRGCSDHLPAIFELTLH
jgi:endonuclease/exonuclease/phosphatase family metal-dependent hydrolase